MGIAAICAGRCKHRQQQKIQLQFRLDIINLANKQTSAIVQLSAAVPA